MYQKVVIDLDYESINVENVNVNREEVAAELRLMEIRPFSRHVFKNTVVELDIRQRARKRWRDERKAEIVGWTKRSAKYILLRTNKF